VISVGHNVMLLDTGWELTRVDPGTATTPAEVSKSNVQWQPAVVPGTVASVMGWETEDATRADQYDHWYRVTLPHANTFSTASGRLLLRFDGLATLAEVWLNDARILASDNMFLAHICDVTQQLRVPGESVLHIRFAALRPVLRQRRSRGRWPTRLVSEKHLRFFRTTLLGYMPGWHPTVPTIGPWRAVSLAVEAGISLSHVMLRPTLDGRAGVLSVDALCRLPYGMRIDRAEVRLGASAAVALSISNVADEEVRLDGVLRVPDVTVWWPHTHGDPALHDVTLMITADGTTTSLRLGRVGFRSLHVDREGDGQGFGIRINGSDVFCRGACWSPLDVAAVDAHENRLRRTLVQARDAGFNMLRVSGTMVYESDAFYALCDELGILVWQDFMFANFDYPVEDTAFVESCRAEAQQFLQRVGARCSIAVLCGGSEVQQQAAMMGISREGWSNRLFEEVLPSVCAEERVDATYVASSPSGGALPFHVNQGVGHYYGVGAYMRPLSDPRRSNVRFASECLAFSNLPEPASLRRWFGDVALALPEAPQHLFVPRDPGAAWDFGDIAAHYVTTLFGANASDLREANPERYLTLSRAAVGEAMMRVIQEFRRQGSGTKGALVWMLRDPQRAAGWGVIDCDDVPKAAYYFLKRACAPRAVWFSDEGVNGLRVFASNDLPSRWEGHLELSLLREAGVETGHVTREVTLPPRSQAWWNVEEVFGHFVDASYAYRFGPPGHRAVCARLVSEGQSERIVEFEPAFHLVPGLACAERDDIGLNARLERDCDGTVLVIGVRGFAQCVSIDFGDCIPSDNYFDVAPGHLKRVRLVHGNGARPLAGTVRALNSGAMVEVSELSSAP